MENNNSANVLSCGECGQILDEGNRVACQKCGSTRRRWDETMEETAKFREARTLNIRQKGIPNRKQPLVSEFSGSAIRKADGQWVKKTQIIDGKQNLYVENVVLEKTGEVLHDVREPLTQHREHGSAKTSAASEEQARGASSLPDSDEAVKHMEPITANTAIFLAAWKGALTADTAEAGFARIREITGAALDDAALARAVAACLTQKLIHDPIRLPEGALHCHWTLELTQAGLTAAHANLKTAP